MDKQQKYRDLVVKRQGCDLCLPHLTNASTIEQGRLDCNEIGAYTQWQGNLNAELMIVGQDFADRQGFIDHRGCPGAAVQTNMRLTRWLRQAGIKIDLPSGNNPSASLFFTNAVLCMKDGGMRGPIPAPCVRACGQAFLRPTVELVSPRLVVTLGREATSSMNEAFNVNPPATLPATGLLPHPTRMFGRTWLMPTYHPMASRKAPKADWREVVRVLASLPTIAAA
jgi:uracil-DNA glycosylase